VYEFQRGEYLEDLLWAVLIRDVVVAVIRFESTVAGVDAVIAGEKQLTVVHVKFLLRC